MENTVNTYGGLNFDTSYDSIQSNFYIDALDIRITTVKGESQASISNIKGNLLSFSIPQLGIGISEIIGSTAIRNTIIIFVADNLGTAGWIYKLLYNEVDHTILIGPTLVYTNPNLAFSKNHPIEAVGRYESDKIQRIYWSDYNQDLRSLNIASSNVLTTPLDLIDINPGLTYNQPILRNVSSGGNLLAGIYQFAYRVITFDGKESLISPPGNLIHTTDISETVISSSQYVGSIKGTNTGKSLVIEIDTTNYSNYEKIELIVLFYEDLNGTPTIKSVESKLINGGLIQFIYSGDEVTSFPITSIDFSLKTYPFSTCKTLVEVDSSLIIANLKSKSFSIQDFLPTGQTFDAKTYRYRNLSGVITTNNDVFNQDYNKDAHWDAIWHSEKQYKYKSDGIRLGGQGPNISYTFHLEPFLVNGSPDPGFANLANNPVNSHNLNDGYNYTNPNFDSLASPFNSGLLRGYKRGETYRFGIVFYTRKGESSFVEFIGDIKFPDISEADSVINASGGIYYITANSTGDYTTAYSLGIQFDINFSTAPSLLSEIESYQIVRLERTNNDKRRLTNGTIRTFSKTPISSSIGTYDFRINGDDQVLHLTPYTSTVTNGNFYSLDSRATDGATHPDLYGDYINFSSPEISYDFNTIPEKLLSDGGPMILITGGLTNKVETSSLFNTSALEQLGQRVVDWRFTHKDVTPCDKISTNSTYPTIGVYRGIEYIKKLKYKQRIISGSAVTINDVITNLFDGYYMRNFYAAVNAADSSANLNEPKNTAAARLHKGPSGILAKMTKITIDPLTNATLPIFSNFEYFENSDNVKILGGSDGQVLCDLVLAKQEIYGGYDSSTLENNVFIPASPVIEKSNTNPIVYGGDIFLSAYTFQSSMTFNDSSYYDAAASNRKYQTNISRTEVIVLESSINIDLAHGSTLKTGVRFDVPGGSSGVKNTVYRQEFNNYDSTYGKTLKMYDYNGVYSEEGTNLSFFIKPNDLTTTVVNDIRAMISNPKINNESIDSWTKFLTNNYYDVDDHGPINKLIKWNKNTYFFQDTAIGIYSINPRAIVTTTDGVETQLGSGQGITYHQYISTQNGSIHQWGIKQTDRAIYYFDAISKKIMMLSDGNNPISEIKGIHSFLNNMDGEILLRKENGGDNPILGRGITIGHDIINDEILFTFRGLYKGSNESKTITYDELVQQFSSKYTITPPIFIDNKNIFLSADPVNPNNIYLQNEGNYGNFYGIVSECFVKLIVNDKADINKVIRFLEFNSIVRNSDKSINRNLTITAFQLDTENQTTGKVLFSPDRFKHKFNKWRLKIPRDQNSVSKQGRLRNTYFVVTLYFDNSSNKELILNRLISYYDIQIF